MRLTLLLGLAVACAVSDPEKNAANGYLEAIEPLLADNGVLYDAVLGAASGVYSSPTEAEKLEAVWVDDITPLAEHLRDQAARVAPPPAWLATHHQLVAAWTQRAHAYRTIATALANDDAAEFASGRSESDTAKAAEEKWFRAVNEKIAPWGLTVDQYP